MMYKLLKTIFSALRTQRTLALENLALRQQLAILSRTMKQPRLTRTDRLFWVFLSRICRDWAQVLVVVKPETVISWHLMGFKLFWRLKSRRKNRGRPRVAREIRDLIRRMSRENPTWSTPRIHGETVTSRGSLDPYAEIASTMSS